MVHMRRRVGERASKKGGSGAAVFLCGDFNGFPGNSGLLEVLVFLIFTRMAISEETPFIIHFLYTSFLHYIMVFQEMHRMVLLLSRPQDLPARAFPQSQYPQTFPPNVTICQLPPTSMSGSCCQRPPIHASLRLVSLGRLPGCDFICTTHERC
jgi:hypothetical protein